MKSKNEIKERRGTILFILIILSPLIIYGTVQVWASYKILQVSNSIEKSIQKKRSNSKAKEINSLQQTNWPSFMKPKNTSLFVGGDMESKIQISQGIQFTAIDSSTIEYQLDFLEDWKKKETIKGKAKLDFESIDKDNYKIKSNNKEVFPAYRFMGKHNNCELELLISKAENPTSSLAKIYLHCPGKTEEFKTIMYFK